MGNLSAVFYPQGANIASNSQHEADSKDNRDGCLNDSQPTYVLQNDRTQMQKKLVIRSKTSCEVYRIY